jgi:threonine dehydrogenase-like Zn-dependent dehydrogenase
MLAVSYEGPRQLRVRHKPEPILEHPNDVLLRVTRAAICGSDLHLYHGLVPDTRVGCTFGHEFTGVVEEIGPSVEKLARGDRVVVPSHIACGACFFCARGLTAQCENTNPSSTLKGGVFGYSHTTGGYDGGQAELVRVPFGDVGPMKIPEGMDDDDVLLLSDVLPTGHYAAELGGVASGDSVVVFGAGPLGLIAARSARLLGAERVIVVDQVAARLAFAAAYASAETIDFRHVDDVIATVRALTGGRGADVCIDAVGCEADGSPVHTVLGRLKLEAGAPTTIGWAIHAARRGGRIVLAGDYAPPANFVPIGAAMSKGLTIHMAQCSVTHRMAPLLEHVKTGRLDGRALITHHLRLEDAPEAYRLVETRAEGCIKCVLVP